MKKLPRKAALPGATLAAARSASLLAVACSTDAPVATRGESAAAATEPSTTTAAVEDEFVAIRIEEDGAVSVNGRPQSNGQLVRSLRAIASPGVIASLEANPGTPYGLVAEVQKSLQEADMLRVVFNQTTGVSVGSESLEELTERGQAAVLPDTAMAARIDWTTVTQTNLRFIDVTRDGQVLVSRGPTPEYRQQLTMNRVESIVSNFLEENPLSIIVLRTAVDADFAYMLEALSGIRAAGDTRFSIQTAS